MMFGINGFDELSGNFQHSSNYGRGGSGDDYVWDAQDGSLAAMMSLNNANFSTPVDGNEEVECKFGIEALKSNP
jgi:hypothetical protein